jgi:hypothetical protein
VIFSVLIVIVVLALVAYRFTETMTAEYRAGVRTADDAQVKLAAVSGLHYAAAILSDRETFYGDLDGNPYDNPAIFEQFEVPAAAGTPGADTRRPMFSIRSVALTDEGGSQQRFGVIDEGGKLNVNSLIMLDPTGQVLYNALMKLPDMTAAIADAIVDWVDADDEPRAEGAESAHYLSLPNPIKAKNGPLNSLDELLFVKGVTPYLLYGGDVNRNGTRDDAEVDDTRGWSDYLTVYGRELNVDMAGTARVYLNGDDLDAIYKQLEVSVGPDLAIYIIASKVFNPQRVQTTSATIITDGGGSGTTLTLTQPAANEVAVSTQQLYEAVFARYALTGSSGKRIRSAFDLVDTKITLPRPPGSPPNAPALVAYSPLSATAGTEAFGQSLALLLDKTTVRQAIEMVPRINVNTAPREVLLGITNPRTGESILTEAEADAIITNRWNQLPTDQGTVTAAWLVTSNTIPATKFRSLERYITGSTMVYRVQSIGYLPGGGPVARMEAVIDTNQGAPRFLMVRDLSDLDNPRAFQPNAPTK